MKAFIFAAGMGTRLKPLTDTMPKALVPVCGRPLIEHVAMKLKDAGIGEAVVNVHHFADMIDEWARSQDIMHIQVSDERKFLLETGGAVLQARRYLEGCGSFLVHNVDILSDVDLKWFISLHQPSAFATLLVSDRKSSRYLLFRPEDMCLVGWTNVNTGEMRLAGPWVDPDRCRWLAFSGIHIMSEEVLDAMHMYAVNHGLYIASDKPRFPIMDFYLETCKNRMIYGVEAEGADIIDVGKLDTLAKAEEFVESIK